MLSVPPIVVDDQIPSYSQDPVLEAARFRPITPEILINPNHYFLRKVFGLCAAIRIAVAQVINPSSKEVYDRFPCGVISSKAALYKFVIA